MAFVRDLLTGRSVLSVDEASTVLDAARIMTENTIGALLVTSGDSLAGIFTERDLMTRVLVPGLDPRTTPLTQVMTRDVYSASPEDKVTDVRAELRQRHIRHVPVLDGEEILGMLSLRDILRADLREKAAEVETMTKYIQRDELGGIG